MTDPAHPMHAGYLIGDKKVDEHINGLYARLMPTTPPEPESQRFTSGWSPDAPLRDLSPDEADAMEGLRLEWREQANAKYAEAQVGMQHLELQLGKETVDDLNEALVASGGDIKLILKIAQYLGHKAHPYVS